MNKKSFCPVCAPDSLIIWLTKLLTASNLALNCFFFRFKPFRHHIFAAVLFSLSISESNQEKFHCKPSSFSPKPTWQPTDFTGSFSLTSLTFVKTCMESSETQRLTGLVHIKDTLYWLLVDIKRNIGAKAARSNSTTAAHYTNVSCYT